MLLLIVLFFSILVAYKHSKYGYIKLIILIFITGKFILFKLNYYYTPTIFNVVGAAIIFLSFYDRTIIKYKKEICISFLAFLFYFGIMPTLRGAGISNSITSVINYKDCALYLLFGAQVIEIKKSYRINYFKVKSFFSNLITFEAILAILQYFIESLSSFFAIRSYSYGGKVHDLIDASFGEQTSRICTGTMATTAEFSIFLSIGLVIMIMLHYRNLKKLVLIKILLVFLALILCGVRGPLIAGLIGVTVTFAYLKNIKLKKIVITSLLVFVALYFFIDLLGEYGGTTYHEQSREDPLSRSLSALVVFSSNDDLENTTLGATFILWTYFIRNPLLGNLSHTIGTGYLFPSGALLEDYSVTDAGISYFLAEYGIMGLIIYIIPLFFYMRISKTICDTKLIVFLILSVILNTIVDAALFTCLYLCFVYLTPIYSNNGKINYVK